MRWVGKKTGIRRTSFQAITPPDRQDLLPLGPGEQGTQESSSPSPGPSGPSLTRCVGRFHQGPPGVSPSVGEFVGGGILCPGVCSGGSSRQHWGPAPGFRGGERRGQVPRLASGQDASRGDWRPGVCRRPPGGAAGLCVGPETWNGNSRDMIPGSPWAFPVTRSKFRG